MKLIEEIDECKDYELIQKHHNQFAAKLMAESFISVPRVMDMIDSLLRLCSDVCNYSNAQDQNIRSLADQEKEVLQLMKSLDFIEKCLIGFLLRPNQVFFLPSSLAGASTSFKLPLAKSISMTELNSSMTSGT